MKRRLLMLLSVFMTITSVGWLQAADTSGDGYTKTDDGNYTVTTAEGLQNVLEILNSGTSVTTTITLENDLDISKVKFMGPNPTKAQWQGVFYLNATEAKITSLTIDGAGHSITGENTSNTVEGSFDPTKNYVFYFDGSGSSPITFKDLTVRNTNILAFNLYNLNNLKFDKVLLSDNKEGGLHLNSSQLTATDFTTSGNGKFAVKLSRQETNMPKFTLKSGTISENNVPQIAFYDRHAYSEWSSNPTTSVAEIIASVVTPENDKWYRSLQLATMHTSNNGALAYVWAKDNDAVTVNTAGQLDSTINLGFATVNKVNLAATTYELGKQLVINRPLTIEGKEATTIKANGSDWSGTNSVKNLISIENGQAGEDVILKNLSVADSKAAGINAQSPMTTSLVNVTLKGNATAGLLVHSKVSAEGLHTEGNVWGGVNVGTDGTPVYSPKFTFSPDCSFAESSKIWSEDITTDPKQLVEGPNGWTSYVGVQGASSEEKRYWTNSKLQMEYVAEFPSNSKYKNTYFIYANGQPVTIATSTAGNLKISVDENDYLEIPESYNPVIFGGSKYADVESSSVTLESGEVSMIFGGGYLGDVKNANVTIKGGRITGYLVGGGYGPKAKFAEAKRQTADVTGKVTMNIENAYVRYMLSGGMEYAKTEATDVKVTGENTDLLYAFGGGFAPVGIGESLDTEYAQIVNRIGKANFSMTKGKISGCFYIGGGYSYSYTKDITATFNEVNIEGGMKGTGSNGCSDKVTATFTKCAFSTGKDGYTPSLAALNRGKAAEVSMAFDNCTFAEGYECYLGADKDWQNGNYPTPVSGKTTMTFVGNAPVVKASEGLQNVVLNGAKANINTFTQKSGTEIKEFTIPENNVWSLNGGLTIASGCKLTNNGTLNLPKEYIMAGISAGGALAVDTTSAAAVVAEMNNASDKIDLNGKTFSIACKDGVIASNETVAKELLNAGKVVYELKFTEGQEYTIASFQKTLAKITNLPDSVVYGTAPITLAFNAEGITAAVAADQNSYATIANNVLTILKPTEELAITLTVSDDKKDQILENTQKLKITKRTLTLTAGIVPNYGADTKGDSIVYNADTDVILKWDAANIAVSGLPWEAAAAAYFTTSTAPTGARANKNVGDKVPVEITNANALLNGDSATYYTLAPITFVTAKVVKAQATVTAKAANNDFGKELPTFEAEIKVIENSKDQLDGTLKFICSATPDSLVKQGGYDIMPYGLTSDNYAIKFVAGKLTVDAVDPKIEIVDAKVTGDADAKTITVRANLVHSGGATTATVTAASEMKAANGAIAKGDDGYYTYTISQATAATHTVTFTATAGDKSGTASINVTVEKGTPQNLTFDSKVLSSIVYGDSLQLAVTSDAAAATGEYTFSVGSGATISNTNVLKPTAAGEITVTVTRAADENYSSATVTKTIKVTPRPLKASVAAFTPKTYDGSVTATVPAITLSADYKVIGTDKVSIKTGATATYASKNVGTHAITLSTLELDGAQKDNYTLIQPTGLKGEITKKSATVKVNDVTRMYNQRYTKYTFTDTGLIEGESLSSVYTGKLDVAEKDGVLALTIDPKLCQNYNLTAQNGTLTITKGTPVVVAYNANDKAEALVVDSAGYTDLKIGKINDAGYFPVEDGSGTVITQSVNAIQQKDEVVNAMLTKATTEEWNNPNPIELVYGGSADQITDLSGYTYSSTNLNRLAVDNGTLTINGVGKVAIIATNTSGDVKVKLYEVTPKPVTYTANMDKTYDGLTQATGTVTLDGVEVSDNVALDMEGVTFNYTSNAAGTKTINPSQNPILVGADANNYSLTAALSGEISPKAVTVSTPISAYYTGSKSLTLDDFTAEGILSNDVVSLNVTLDNEEVGPRQFTLNSLGGNHVGNYTLFNKNAQLEGSVLKPTIIVEVPETASSVANAKSKLTYTIRETGKVVPGDAFSEAIQVVSLGNNAYQVSTKEDFDNKNFTLLYTKNLIGFKADPVTPPSGGDEDETVTISLDATTKDLPRTEEFILTATVSPAGKTVTWSSSDPTVASVTADGNKVTVKGVKVGKATITATIGDVTATCEVTVGFATGLEEALANTEVFGRKGNIYVNPIQPLQVTVVNMIGKIVYNARISGNTQIPVTKGIYIVKLTNAGNSIVTKVNVY
ncbi:YDG domain-containing protein [Parabacteroides hominis]|uniref:Ig-like domain-containing protein n=3 Tax=Parabacteroides TaxID=375288 RepID=A0ABR7DQB0_9BACT|nr:YDG domain-containing protein [Parabacteroides hominis]MBC5633003.1 Ig-like domain-containing protein [Parabacteroides hominis]